jgi:hypothetical protein
MKAIIIYPALLMIGLSALKAGEASAEKQKANTSKTIVMEDKSFTTTIVVDQSPREVFNAINNVRGWWSEEVEGGTVKLNDEFDYHFQDVHRCKMRIIESVAGKKVVWLVLQNHFKFTQDQTEWVGTKVSFEITKKGDKTELVFTHIGLVPQHECYKICHDAWTGYIQNSLRDLIATGKGQPNGKEKPQTEDEKRLSETKG